MNYLQIALTSKCNMSCLCCPMANYRNTDDPTYHLNNDVLIPFISKHIDPGNWLIELTGGEPTLYNGYDELLDWLSEAGYIVHVRSNGVISTKARKGLTRIIAFHDLSKPPKNYDVVLIVDKLNSKQKISFCTDNNIPYRVIGFNKESFDDAKHEFNRIAFIDPSCHQVSCPSQNIEQNIKMLGGKLVDLKRLEYANFITDNCCPHCKAAIDAWRFL